MASDHHHEVGMAQCQLLRLPLELRQQIYGLVFGTPRLVHFCGQSSYWHKHVVYRLMSGLRGRCYRNILLYGGTQKRTGILGVSRFFSNEALDVLYGENVFVVYICGRDPHHLSRLTVPNLRRIRHLRILARPGGRGYKRPLAYGPELWLPVLEGLRQFCVVAQQPLEARRSLWGPAQTLEQELVEWTTWLGPILEFFSTNLPKTTAISLDDDGHMETREIMDAHFGLGYQIVRTDTGDPCFKRGKYSGQLGVFAYWEDDLISSDNEGYNESDNEKSD